MKTNSIIRIFKYSGFSLIFIALLFLALHFVSAAGAYRDGVLQIKVKEKDAMQNVKIINGLKFRSSNIGILEIKPNLIQSIVLSDKEFKDNGASVIFYLILGVVISLIAKFKPVIVENLTESKLWKMVGVGGIAFIGLKFLMAILADHYVEKLAGTTFKYYYSDADSINLNVVFLIMVISVVYELLSYSRKLKQENDLTI